MAADINPERIRAIAARVLDLRAECEAQLRAVARLEAQLQKSGDGKDGEGRRLEEAVRRALADMLTNNKSIRDVLTELAKDASSRITS